uniref:YqaJ viral recombinase domain-containing protein n=1 Tax=viral metagenome TaxID=1070528 RepID=A0A6C0HU78_9ZZZZ
MVNQNDEKIDSDYIPSDNDTYITNDTDTESIQTTMTHISSLLENLEEQEFLDIVNDIYNQFDDFLNDNIGKLSSPNFYKDMFYYVAYILYEEWMDAELYGDVDDDSIEDEIFNELLEFIEHVWNIYIDVCDIPVRSIKYKDLSENSVSNKKLRESKEKIHEKIERLNSMPQPAQRTPEWYEFRNNLLSASNLSKIFGSASQLNSIIYEKCQPQNANTSPDFSKTNTSLPTHWGVKYEPITAMIYEKMFRAKIGEFGCIRHSIHEFIGASPDGINIDPESLHYGRMLEIKNIVNRDITGIPKEEYWVQCQIQMETCDLNFCDFMETRILEYKTEQEFYQDSDRKYRGVVLYFIEKDRFSESVNIPKYKYMPLSVELNEEEIYNWISQTRESVREEGLVLFNTLYWYLEEYSCVLIPRNKPWFEAVFPMIRETWDIILKERVEGFEHRSPKKKEKKIVNTIVTSDVSGNSYTIENLNMDRTFCLVKLG